jgi:hypothetical protein
MKKTLLLEDLHVADEVKELVRYLKPIMFKLKMGKHNFTISKDEYTVYLTKRGYNSAAITKLAFFLELYFDVNVTSDTYGGNAVAVHNKNDIKWLPNKYLGKHDQAIIIEDKANIELSFKMINNSLDNPENNEAIIHELNHVFQTMRKSNKVRIFSKHKIRMFDKYTIAKNNTNNKNYFIKTLSKIYYYLNRDEQDAYGNGLYAILIKNKPNKPQEFVKYTQQYERLNYFKTLLNNIDIWQNKTYQMEFQEAKELFFNKALSDEFMLKSIKTYLTQEISRYEKILSGNLSKYLKDISIKEIKTMSIEEREEERKRLKKLLEQMSYRCYIFQQ